MAKHPSGLFVALLAALSAGGVCAAPVMSEDPVSTQPGSELVINGGVDLDGLKAREASDATTRTQPAAMEPAPTRANTEAALAATRPPETGAEAIDRPADIDNQDPLRAALRSMVNVERRSATATKPPRSKANGADRSLIDPETAPLDLDLDEHLREAALDIKSAAADIVRTAFSPRIDDNGRTSFSIAGVEGFQLNADGKALSIGLNNYQLASVDQGSQGNPGAYNGPEGRSRQYRDADHVNPIRELIELIKMLRDHPMTWLVGTIALLGWISFALASKLAARRTRQPAPTKVRRRRRHRRSLHLKSSKS